MSDPLFFRRPLGLSLREIAALTRASPRPGAPLDRRVNDVAPLDRTLRPLVAREFSGSITDVDLLDRLLAEFEVDLVPLTGEAAQTVQDDLRRMLAGFPGVNFAIRGFLAERIEETLTGSTAESNLAEVMMPTVTRVRRNTASMISPWLKRGTITPSLTV